jgi:choline dehydrogenase-like flavoprotein
MISNKLLSGDFKNRWVWTSRADATFRPCRARNALLSDVLGGASTHWLGSKIRHRPQGVFNCARKHAMTPELSSVQALATKRHLL